MTKYRLAGIVWDNTNPLSSNRFRTISVALFQQRYFVGCSKKTEFGNFHFTEWSISSFPAKQAITRHSGQNNLGVLSAWSITISSCLKFRSGFLLFFFFFFGRLILANIHVEIVPKHICQSVHWFLSGTTV